MGRILLASTGFAVIMELVVVPSFNTLLTESRWSLLAFIGAVMFLLACSNLFYCVDWHLLTYANAMFLNRSRGVESESLSSDSGPYLSHLDFCCSVLDFCAIYFTTKTLFGHYILCTFYIEKLKKNYLKSSLTAQYVGLGHGGYLLPIDSGCAVTINRSTDSDIVL